MIQEDGQSRKSKDAGKSERMYKMHKLETHSRSMSAEVDAMRKRPGRSMGFARGKQHGSSA